MSIWVVVAVAVVVVVVVVVFAVVVVDDVLNTFCLQNKRFLSWRRTSRIILVPENL